MPHTLPESSNTSSRRHSCRRNGADGSTPEASSSSVRPLRAGTETRSDDAGFPGLAVVWIGQTLRSFAMISASSNFSHL